LITGRPGSRWWSAYRRRSLSGVQWVQIRPARPAYAGRLSITINLIGPGSIVRRASGSSTKLYRPLIGKELPSSKQLRRAAGASLRLRFFATSCPLEARSVWWEPVWVGHFLKARRCNRANWDCLAASDFLSTACVCAPMRAIRSDLVRPIE
jgi:hypothetical protein